MAFVGMSVTLIDIQEIGVLNSRNFPNLVVAIFGFNFRPADPTNDFKLTMFMVFYWCRTLRYVDVLHQPGMREEWCIYRYHDPFRSTQNNNPEKIRYGYPTYWWHPHELGVSEEIRASIGI